MDNLSFDLKYLILKNIYSYKDALSMRFINKDFYNEIPFIKIKILFLNKILDPNYKYKISRVMNCRGDRMNSVIPCINGETCKMTKSGTIYFRHGIALGRVLLYYPFYIKKKELTQLSYLMLTIASQVQIHGLFRKNPFITETDCLAVSSSTGFEILGLADQRIKPDETKYGRCYQRYIPYCRHCVNRWQMLDIHCPFIIKIRQQFINKKI